MLNKVGGTICIIAIVLTGSLFAHSGRTDKYGGHNNRKTGGYHYHNAGSVHQVNNPHQDHTRCGICLSLKKRPEKGDELELGDKEVISALQAGLKCMGFEISKVDGIMGATTKAAVRKYLSGKKYKDK